MMLSSTSGQLKAKLDQWLDIEHFWNSQLKNIHFVLVGIQRQGPDQGYCIGQW